MPTLSAHAPGKPRGGRRRRGAALFTAVVTALALGATTATTWATAAQSSSDAVADDVVLEWNRITYRTFAERGYTPPVQALLGSFTATAVFGAVNTIEGGYQSYVAQDPAAPGASVDAAVATATHRVLLALGPTSPALEADLATWLSSVQDPAARDAGIEVGEDAAETFMATRVADGRFDTSISLTTTPGPGIWDVPPTGMAAAWMGFVRPLAVPSQTWIDLDGPDPLTSAEYAADFNEVKAKGAKVGSTRTAKQTETALFYSVNLLPQYNAALRDRFDRHDGTATDAARAFAIANVAMADAIIVGWRVKYDVHNWRPEQAIERADTDGNDATALPQCDKPRIEDCWDPLVPNPAYGDYVSGHAVATGAFQESMAKLFGPGNLDLYISSSATSTTRHYDTAAELKRDTENARIWLGLHFRKAMDDGNRVGRKTADYVYANEFRPTG